MGKWVKFAFIFFFLFGIQEYVQIGFGDKDGHVQRKTDVLNMLIPTIYMVKIHGTALYS